jgi:hypothetical protein
MSSAAALIVLLASACIALRLAPSLCHGADALTRAQVYVLLGAAAFFLAFHLLGAAQLLWDIRIVTVGHAALLLGAAALAVAWLPRQPRGMAAPWSLRLPGTVPRATAAVYALTGAMLVCAFPQGYEVLAYHLPAAVAMLQTHSLQAWDGSFPHTFPANASVLAAFLLAAGPERLVSAMNLLWLPPLALATYGLCRLADADRRAALLATGGLLSVPMVAFSIAEPSADIGGLTMVALALYCALCRQLPRHAGPVLAGLAAGLAFGFKSLHLIGALLVGGLICVRHWRDGAVRAGTLYSAALFLTAGFWLARNALAYGNPLFPVVPPLVGTWLGWRPAADVDFALRHATQFEWVATPAQWLIYPWQEPHRWGQNFKHSAGLGAFVAAALPGTALAFGGALWRDGWRVHGVRLALLLAAAGVMAAWWLLDDHQPRYALAALPCFAALAAWAVTQAQGRWRRLFDGVLGLCVLAMLAVFLSRQALTLVDRVVLARQTTRAEFYEYPPLVDRLPAGTVILNLADRNRHYPLAGAQLGNRVVSMPAGRRLLGLPPSLTAPAAATLRGDVLRAAGITHIYAAGVKLSHDDAMRLLAIARLDRNPVNGRALAQARVLYRVEYLPSILQHDGQEGHGIAFRPQRMGGTAFQVQHLAIMQHDGAAMRLDGDRAGQALQGDLPLDPMFGHRLALWQHEPDQFQLIGLGEGDR